MKTVKNNTWHGWPTAVEQSQYPFPMERPLSERELIDSMPTLENEEMWSQRVIDELAKEQLINVKEYDNEEKK